MRTLLCALCLSALTVAAQAEVFVDVGIHATQIDSRFAGRPDTVDRSETGLHAGVGVRRALTRGDVGARIEIDNLGSDLFLALRAFDYRYRRSERLAFNAFIGAGRLDLATPAYGFYLGAGVQLREFVRDWDLNIDVRFAERVARDNLLPTDPVGPSPDNFHDVAGVSIYLSRRF
jgi:hypothetical protein